MSFNNFSLLIISLLFLPLSSYSEELNTPILLGQSSALSGPAKNLGVEMRVGLQAAINEQNAQGGINGRELILISKDDGYEPYKAVRNTLEFIHDLDVFMLIGEVGTPTSKAVLPLVSEHKIPLFAPLTGAELLRKPFNRYVVNVRASYYQEMERIARYLIDEKKLTRIACFYQNDSYGHTGLKGIEVALNKRGIQLVSKGSYERNTVAVLGGMNDIDKGEPQAVVLVGAYSACVEYIKLDKLRNIRERIYCNISFVGSKSLQTALGNYNDNVIVSQVVPFPWDMESKLIQKYQRALKTYQKDFLPGFGSLEGYIAGRLFCTIAKKVEGALTRESFLNTLYKVGTFDIGGFVLNFGENDNQGNDSIYLTEMKPEFSKID